MKITQKTITDLQDYMKGEGLTQAALSGIIGISKVSVSKLMSGPFPKTVRSSTYNAIIELVYDGNPPELFATPELAKLAEFIQGVPESKRADMVNQFIADNFRSYQEPKGD